MAIKTTSLDQRCELIVDCPHSTPEWTDEGVIVLRSKNIKNGCLDLSNPSYTTEEGYIDRTRRATLRGGDLVITREAPMGEICRVPEGLRCCLGQRQVLIRPKSNSGYLLYAIQSPYVQKQIRGHDATGSTVSNLCIPDLKALRIPELPNESGIANVLATLDAKIELNNRINAELEGMAKQLYDYWFVQFDFPLTAAQAAAMRKPKLKGKPYRASGGKMIFNETLKREIPEEWRHGTADSLFSFNPTVTLRDGTVAGFFDMDAVPVRGFMTKKMQRKAFSGGTKFANGDVVVARITPCLENGKTALITQLEDGQVGFGSTEFIVMRGKPRSLSAFGACLARSEHYRNFAILNMTGTSGRKRIEASVLKTFPLSFSPIELLSNFEDICEPMFQKMTANEKENQELTQLRDWLLPMLMNGQVTVG